MTGPGVPKDERKGLKWIHKSAFQGGRSRDVDNIVGGVPEPAIDYCKEHGYKWY